MDQHKDLSTASCSADSLLCLDFHKQRYNKGNGLHSSLTPVDTWESQINLPELSPVVQIYTTGWYNGIMILPLY